MSKLLSDREDATWTIIDGIVEEGKHALEHNDPAVMAQFFQYAHAKMSAVPSKEQLERWEYVFQDLYLHASSIGTLKALAWLKATHDQYFNKEAQDQRARALYKHANGPAYRNTGERWRINAYGPWTPPRVGAEGRKRPLATDAAAGNRGKRARAAAAAHKGKRAREDDAAHDHVRLRHL